MSASELSVHCIRMQLDDVNAANPSLHFLQRYQYGKLVGVGDGMCKLRLGVLISIIPFFGLPLTWAHPVTLKPNFSLDQLIFNVVLELQSSLYNHDPLETGHGSTCVQQRSLSSFIAPSSGVLTIFSNGAVYSLKDLFGKIREYSNQ